MTLRIRLELSGPRGIGKTHIANEISGLVDEIQRRVPTRQIELTVVEVWEPARRSPSSRLLGPQPDRYDEW